MMRVRLALVAAATLSILGTGALGWTSATPGPGRASFPPGPQERTLTDGVYTPAQAERGSEVYRRVCVDCHQRDEYKGFLRRWVGLPVGYFYEVVRSTMPQNNPGALSRDEYADVLTYIFSINGVPTGDEEMSSDPEQLDAITITVPEEPEDDSAP